MRTPRNFPAFPRSASETPNYGASTEQDGMTLRDWFAGQALMGLMANSDLPDLFKKGFAPHKAAEISYAVADAMLEARDQRPAKGGA